MQAEGTQSAVEPIAELMPVDGSEVVAEVAATDLEVLTKVKSVTVGGRVVKVGKLSIDQWLGLAQVTTRTALTMPPDQLQRLQAAAKTAEGNPAGLMVFFSLFKPETVGELYGVLANLPAKHCEDTFDLVELIELLEALSDENDLMRVVATFKRVAGRWLPPSKS
jgi:muconolactone delta-isomerase